MKLAALLLTLAPPAVAQSFSIVHREGETVPGVGTLRVVGKVAVNDHGDWLVEADMELPGSTGFGDFALLGSNGVVIAPQQDLPGLPGISADFYRGIGLTRDGEAVSIATLIGAPIDQRIAVLVGDRVERRSGFPVAAAGVPAAATWSTMLNGPLVTATGRLHVVGDLFPTGSGIDRSAIVEYTVDAGAVAAGEAIVVEGDTIGAGLVVRPQLQAIALSDAGHRLFGALVSMGGSVLVLDGSIIAVEGQPSVVPGRPWASTLVTALGSLNGSGQYALATKIVGDPASEFVLVKDGALYRQSGDTLPAIAPFVIERFTPWMFGIKDRPQITESGAVLWGARWNDPAPLRGAGLFLDDRLIVETGVTRVGPKTVSSIDEGGWRVSPNGRWLILRCTLTEPGQLNLRAIVLVDLSVGTELCSPAVPNSTGVPAAMTATAPVLAAGAPLELIAHDVPPGSMGYFLVAPSPGFVVQPGGSQGTLCLASPIGRFVGQSMLAGPGGYLRTTVDTTALPLTPNRPIAAGQTWTFQGWYRDANPTPTSNFTSAVSVAF